MTVLYASYERIKSTTAVAKRDYITKSLGKFFREVGIFFINSINASEGGNQGVYPKEKQLNHKKTFKKEG